MTENQKYAVIRQGGLQYKVQAGQVIKLNKFAAEEGSSVELDSVLLVGTVGGDTTVGSPVVEGATVSATVLGATKGPKVIAFKRKRRKGFKKKIGHRQQYVSVRIDAINA